MNNLLDKWKKGRFSIYDSEEKSVLGIIKNIYEFISNIIINLDNKTDLYGDHKGSWQGLNKPTLSEEGAFAQVEKNMFDIELLQEQVDITPYFLMSKYGILGNGTDETEKLQTALNENSVVYIPNDYTIGISSMLTVQGNKQIISDGGKILCLTDGLYSTLQVNQGEDILIKGITFDMNLKGRTSIDIANTNRYTIENCKFTGYTAEFGWYATDGGIRVDKSKDGIIKNNFFYDHGTGYGTTTETLNRCIGLGSGCNNTLVEGNSFTRVSQAIVTDSPNIRIVNNHFEDIEDNSVYCVGGSENVIIDSNTFFNALDECIVLSGVGQFTVSNNNFDEVRNKCIAINSTLKNVSIIGNNFRCTTVIPANVIAWRSDKYNVIVDNFVVTNNVVSLPLSTGNELFSFGNIRGGIFENNFITVIATNKIFAFRGVDWLKWTFRNNTIDNTDGTYTTLLDYPVAISNKDYVFDNCKIVNGRIGTPVNASIKNMRFQNTGSTIYLINQSETSIYYGASAPTTPMKCKTGDIVYNTAPTSGGYVGWVCVEGDGTTLGTWKGFGVIES